MKNFIIEVSKTVTNSIKELLISEEVFILYEDKLLKNILFIETHNIESVKKLPFVIKVEECRTLSLQSVPSFDFDISPHLLDEDLLHQKGMYGWGKSVLIVDSGYNEIMATSKINLSNKRTFLSRKTDSEDITSTIKHGNWVTSIIHRYAPCASFSIAQVADGSTLTEQALFEALDWGHSLGNIDVINLSLGYCSDCTGNCFLARKINKLCELGYIVVTAAGNITEGKEKVHCPGCSEKAITVGGLNVDGDNVSETSCVGLVNGPIKPEFLVPSNITLSTGNIINGTSFASPIVAGILTAIPQKKVPNIIENLKMHLIQSCEILKNASSYAQGYGRLSLSNFLESIKN